MFPQGTFRNSDGLIGASGSDWRRDFPPFWHLAGARFGRHLPSRSDLIFLLLVWMIRIIGVWIASGLHHATSSSRTSFAPEDGFDDDKKADDCLAYVTRHHGTGQAPILHKRVARLFSSAAEDITATHEDITATHNVALFGIG